MAKGYFVRGEISIEEMSGEGGWKAGAGVPDESGKGLSGGDSWEEKKR